jgi:hypothetical protein
MMQIKLVKFGDLLTSRQDGREALAAIRPELNALGASDKIEIDFMGVKTFTPSWGDEFITKIIKEYNKNVTLVNTENASVQATLDILEIQ